MNKKRGKVITLCIQVTFLFCGLFLHTQIVFATANYLGSITIDSPGAVGKYTSIALDSLDAVHISYYDETNTALKYATNSSGAWTVETVDNTGAVGQYTSIAVDSLDTIHIGYDENNSQVTYAQNTTGLWNTEDIPSASSVVFSSIALDFANNVHLSYYDKDWCLKYSTNSSGAWETIRAESINKAEQYSSIVIDAAGNGYISYYGLGDLKLSLVGQIDLAASPQSYYFGDYPDNDKWFTMKNTGNTDISLGELIVTGTNPTKFGIVSNDCSFANLLSNETCEFQVFFYLIDGRAYATVSIPVISMGSETIYLPLKCYADFDFDWAKGGVGGGG